MQAVKMYTTAVCPYCQQAKQLLKRRGVEQVEEIRIDQIPGEREKMMALTGRQVRSNHHGLTPDPNGSAATIVSRPGIDRCFIRRHEQDTPTVHRHPRAPVVSGRR
jgi:hypothetical protein